MKCEYVTFVWWFRGGSTNNPLGSIGIFILKDSILPEVLYLPRVRKKSENLKQQNPKWWISKWRRCQQREFNDAFVWPPFTCATTAHFLSTCRLPAVARHLPATILIFKPSTRKIVKQNNENWKEAKTTLHNLNKFWSIDSTSFTKCNTTFAQKHIDSWDRIYKWNRVEIEALESDTLRATCQLFWTDVCDGDRL